MKDFYRNYNIYNYIILYANIEPTLSFFLELYKQKLAYCILNKIKV